MIIYKITNILNGKLYIGQTTKTLKQRIDWHRNSMVSMVDTHLYNAMRKYGWDNFKFEEIATAQDKDTLDELEAYFIKKYDTIRNGYNMAPGGVYNPMSSEVVAEKHHQKMRTLEVRQKISESMKASYAERGGPTKEHRQHLSQSRKELYASEKGDEIRAKFRKSFKFSPEHFKALNDAKNKSVYCIDEKGETIAEFERVKDAAKWWYDQGYKVKDVNQLSDRIKQSARENRYIRGIKWIYRV